MGTAMRVPLVLLAILIGAGFAFEGDSREESPPRAPRAGRAAPAAPIATIEARVERLRGLRFRTRPRPQQVSAAQARRDGLEDLDRTYPPAERRADEEVLKLLGLLDASVDLRQVSASVFGEAVAGYYDPRTKQLRIVRGPQTSNRVLEEITLAHELTHALEDQRFGLDVDDASGSDDAALARLALVEGSATEVMFGYAQRHFSAEQTLGGLLASLGADTGDLPPFIEDQLIFPYIEGQRFIRRLFATGADSWSLVNSAYHFRPPASTEQVLHPDKYLHVEQPDGVRVRAQRVLGAGWRRLGAGTWGEWATRELLVDAGAAEGWGGDRYELWRRGGGDCRAPCRGRDALVMRWRWDSRRDAREASAALRRWRARERPRSGVAIRSRGLEVALVLAPGAAEAQRLVE